MLTRKVGLDSRWDFQKFEELLQGTRVIRIKQGLKQSWQEILKPHLPESIHEVEIYDRFLRNRYQFKSLEMFMEAVAQKASPDGAEVSIMTTSELVNEVARKFERIKESFAEKGMKIKYKILKPSKEMPHFRRVQIHSNKGRCSIWLDRGLDIFRFQDLTAPSFSTLETYIVIDCER